MKKSYIILLVVCGILFIAAITNPSTAKHKEAVKNKISATMPKEANDDASEVMSDAIANAFLDTMVDNIVSTNNYVLFSLTKATMDDKSAVIGFGAFGKVFITEQFKE